MAIRLADTTRPNNYVDKDNIGTFPVAYAENIWTNSGKTVEEALKEGGGSGGQTIQVEELPTPSLEELGKIYQYVGDSGTYTNGYFYECIEKDGSYQWSGKLVQAQSGGLSKAITAAIEVGGIDAGTTFDAGTGFEEMWDALLNPTLYPTFTNPSLSITYTANTYYKIGSVLPAAQSKLNYNAGAITINEKKQDNRGGSATNFTLSTSGADNDYEESSATSSIFSVPSLTKTTKGTIVLTGVVEYGAGPQPLDSKGNDYGEPLPAGSVTATKTINFIQPYYYGKSSSATISDFSGLTESIAAKGNKSFSFTTSNEYMVVAYDSAYGNLSSIIDPNGFETISGWNKSDLTVDGFTYRVYIAKSATTDTNAKFTFKY